MTWLSLYIIWINEEVIIYMGCLCSLQLHVMLIAILNYNNLRKA